MGNLKKIIIHLPDTTELLKHAAPGATFYAVSVIMHWGAWMDAFVYCTQQLTFFSVVKELYRDSFSPFAEL